MQIVTMMRLRRSSLLESERLIYVEQGRGKGKTSVKGKASVV